MARWEIVVIALLVITGGGGFIQAKRSLAAKESEGVAVAAQRTKEFERVRSDQERLEGLVHDAGGIVPAAGEQTRLAAQSPASGQRASDPQAAAAADARSAALTHVADLISKGLLRADPLTAAGGRGGQDSRAFAISPEGKLPDGFGELFDLRADQVARLQEVVDSIKQQAEAQLANRASVRPAGDNSYTVEIAAAPEEATRLRDLFVSEFTGVLGEDHYREFVKLNGERTLENGTTVGGPSTLFSSGLGDARTVTITRTDRAFQFTATSGNSRGGGSSPNLERLVGGRIGIAPVLKLLPPDFVAPFPERPGGLPAVGPAEAGGGGGDAPSIRIRGEPVPIEPKPGAI